MQKINPSHKVAVKIARIFLLDHPKKNKNNKKALTVRIADFVRLSSVKAYGHYVSGDGSGSGEIFRVERAVTGVIRRRFAPFERHAIAHYFVRFEEERSAFEIGHQAGLQKKRKKFYKSANFEENEMKTVQFIHFELSLERQKYPKEYVEVPIATVSLMKKVGPERSYRLTRLLAISYAPVTLLFEQMGTKKFSLTLPFIDPFSGVMPYFSLLLTVAFQKIPFGFSFTNLNEQVCSKKQGALKAKVLDGSVTKPTAPGPPSTPATTLPPPAVRLTLEELEPTVAPLLAVYKPKPKSEPKATPKSKRKPMAKPKPKPKPKAKPNPNLLHVTLYAIERTMSDEHDEPTTHQANNFKNELRTLYFKAMLIDLCKLLCAKMKEKFSLTICLEVIFMNWLPTFS
uniref:Uncharacterized protein n=1 Tax=Romanomermis culicivorax TaxID=13658 RepID=A0A915KS59_ROMCU